MGGCGCGWVFPFTIHTHTLSELVYRLRHHRCVASCESSSSVYTGTAHERFKNNFLTLKYASTIVSNSNTNSVASDDGLFHIHCITYFSFSIPYARRSAGLLRSICSTLSEQNISWRVNWSTHLSYFIPMDIFYGLWSRTVYMQHNLKIFRN